PYSPLPLIRTLLMPSRSRRRHLHVDVLEPRVQPAALRPLEVALISDSVAQAAPIQAAAMKNVLAVSFDSSSATLESLVSTLQSLSQSHGGASIGHLGLVAHGSAGHIAFSPLDTLDAGDVAQDSPAWADLRQLLAAKARIDLYACDVAAGDA